ncbi:MAG: hypothetical protein VX498_08190 [Myxococcota bacterium]|nr:hypothetical protein [Myxococcota bacterium]
MVGGSFSSAGFAPSNTGGIGFDFASSAAAEAARAAEAALGPGDCSWPSCSPEPWEDDAQHEARSVLAG